MTQTLDDTIDCLNLSPRTHSALANADVTTLRALKRVTADRSILAMLDDESQLAEINAGLEAVVAKLDNGEKAS